MSLKLYLDACSPPCRAIILFCRMNKIEFLQENVSFITGTTKTDAFGKVSLFKKVPVLQDNDFTLTESAAILPYLVEKYKCPDHWYPADFHQRARVNEMVMSLFSHDGLRFLGARIFIEQALIPHRTGNPADKKVLEERKVLMQTYLDKFENYFIKDGKFIGGRDDISLADLLAICEMMQDKSVGYDVTTGRPKLAAWFEKTKTRLEPHFEQIHQEVFEFGSKYLM